VRGVFDDRDTPARGDGQHTIEVAGVPAVVEQDHRLRTRPERGLEIGRVEVEIVGAEDVAEDRCRADRRDGVRRSDEVERRQDDLVARTTAEREQREVQGGRAVRDGECMPRSGELCERLLEPLDTRPHAPPAGRKRLAAGLQELCVDPDVGQRHAPAGLAHRPPPPGWPTGRA
jgi:hypothetical protein